MQLKAYFIAAFFALSTMTMSQPSHAQPALGGTDWEADDDCLFYGLHFSGDGTGKIITIVDDGELKTPITWVLEGARLSVKFPDNPDESMVGDFDGAGLRVTDHWRDKDNRAHVTTCTFTQIQ